ncbi:hypothetical protein L596_024612 [Steinernema carpocapsae]|uniref:Uncharacterized protein n=1 Tax=Steinernema carpocapsae TaxID=34508 RepID=A0A4U5M5A4_STECR|nr:hypothetical protein L596_024612 [Steinernema carpocapsae]
MSNWTFLNGASVSYNMRERDLDFADLLGLDNMVDGHEHLITGESGAGKTRKLEEGRIWLVFRGQLDSRGRVEQAEVLDGVTGVGNAVPKGDPGRRSEISF